jgi:hypothetical protein
VLEKPVKPARIVVDVFAITILGIEFILDSANDIAPVLVAIAPSRPYGTPHEQTKIRKL